MLIRMRRRMVRRGVREAVGERVVIVEGVCGEVVEDRMIVRGMRDQGQWISIICFVIRRYISFDLRSVGKAGEMAD